MRKPTRLLAMALPLALVLLVGNALAGEPCWNCGHVAQPWHGGYYHTAWGSPVALIVPPTAAAQTRWGWGVGQTTVRGIYPQFGRSYVAPHRGAGPRFRPTPVWPSHTDQFGVYYVRGPWSH